MRVVSMAIVALCGSAVSALGKLDLRQVIADAEPDIQDPKHKEIANRLLTEPGRIATMSQALDQLVATLPADSRFDITSDYQAAANYLVMNSWNPPNTIPYPTEAKRTSIPLRTVPYVGVQVPDKDEMLPDFTIDELSFLNNIFQNIPMRSNLATSLFASGEDHKTLINSRMFGKGFGDRKYHTYATSRRYHRDTIKKVVWDDWGQHRIQAPEVDDPYREGATHMVDLLYMQDFEVKPGYAQYGARCYFRAGDHMPTHILLPGNVVVRQTSLNADWKWAKLRFMSSLVFDVTMRDHLFGLHMTTSNSMVIANQLGLGPGNPVRRLLTLFGFGAAKITKKATVSLMGEQGIIVRSSSLTPAGLEAYMTWIGQSEKATFQEFPDQIAAQNLERWEVGATTAYKEDGLKFYNIVYDFVFNFLKTNIDRCNLSADMHAWWQVLQEMRPNSQLQAAWPDPRCSRMAKVIATYITEVTAVHYHVGSQIISATSHPCMAPFNLVDLNAPNALVDKSYACGSPHAIMYAYLLMSASTIKQPMLLDSYAHYFMDGNYEGNSVASAELMATFQSQLVDLEAEISAANTNRPVKLHSFMASNLEISTAN